ncbi:MAG: hypothetical protein ACRDGN_00670 [bacterium]
MAGRMGITHYAWPGGLATVVEGPASGIAAVFGPGGWRIGPAQEVLSETPPQGAEMYHLALPETLTDQVAASLHLVGSGIHTDFVHLDRLVARLQADGTDAAVFVLGRAPAALVLSGGQVTVVEPRHEPLEEVLTGAEGWIVVGLGRVSLPAPAAPRRADARPHREPAPVVPASAPVEPIPAPIEPVPAPVAPVSPPAQPEPAQVDLPSPAGASADGATAAPGAFGRFAPDALFVLAHDAADRLSAEASAQIAGAAGDAGRPLMALLDGAHTLSAIAAASGLAPSAVTSVVEVLLTHRLVFKYVSRVRPATGASTAG